MSTSFTGYSKFNISIIVWVLLFLDYLIGYQLELNGNYSLGYKKISTQGLEPCKLFGGSQDHSNCVLEMSESKTFKHQAVKVKVVLHNDILK